MIISFNAYRGGNGKTTMAINLAYMLAKKGKNVLLLDFDGRAPALQDYLYEFIENDVVPKTYIDYIVLKQVDFQDCIGNLKINDVKFDTVFLAPKHGISPRKLLNLQRSSYDVVSEEYSKLSNAFEYASEEYDYILLDASPGYDNNNMMLIASLSEAVFLVTRAHKIDLKQTILYNFIAYNELFNEKRKAYPYKKLYINFIINEIVDFRFTEKILEDIITELKISNMNINDSIVKKIKFYEEIRKDGDPTIFIANNPEHPFYDDIEDIANFIVEMDSKMEE